MSWTCSNLEVCLPLVISLRYPDRVTIEELSYEVVMLRVGELRLYCRPSMVNTLGLSCSASRPYSFTSA